MARVDMNPGLKRSYALPQNSRNWSNQAANVGKQAIAAAAPLRTGFLKSTIRTRKFPGRIGPTVRYIAVPEYALWQEVGTGIYGPIGKHITPKQARLLSWIDANSGERRFAKRVRGTPPKRYFRKGLNATFGSGRVVYYGAKGPSGIARIQREGG